MFLNNYTILFTTKELKFNFTLNITKLSIFHTHCVKPKVLAYSQSRSELPGVSSSKMKKRGERHFDVTYKQLAQRTFYPEDRSFYFGDRLFLYLFSQFHFRSTIVDRQQFSRWIAFKLRGKMANQVAQVIVKCETAAETFHLGE